MKRAALFSLLSVVLAFILAICLSPRPTEAPAADGPTASPEPPGEESAAAAGEEEAELSHTLTDADLKLRVLMDGQTREMSMEEYLPMALMGEMPAGFEPEALKAQAVALRSYALYYRAAPKAVHPEADICASAACCAAARTAEEMAESWGAQADEYARKIADAVKATDGQYLSYEEEAILAMFHSSSMGATEHSSELRNPLPYLLSVGSPETAEDVKNLLSTVEVSPEDFRETISRSFPALSLEGEPSAWLGSVTPSAGGRVGSINIGGQEISGLTMRQMFSLRSTDFQLKWTGGNFLFTVSGYGHGLGMSQYGANTMAKEGESYAEILSHYYPGTELVVAVVRGE